MKPFLLIVGLLAAVLIVAQLVMGLLILQGQTVDANRPPAFRLSDGGRQLDLHRLVAGRDCVAPQARRAVKSPSPAPNWAVRARLIDLQNRRDRPVGCEQPKEEPRFGVVAKERSGSGRHQAAINDVRFASPPAYPHGKRPVSRDRRAIAPRRSAPSSAAACAGACDPTRPGAEASTACPWELARGRALHPSAKRSALRDIGQTREPDRQDLRRTWLARRAKYERSTVLRRRRRHPRSKRDLEAQAGRQRSAALNQDRQERHPAPTEQDD